MKQSQYLKIFRSMWLILAIGFIFMFLEIDYTIGLILAISAFIIAFIFAMVRLNYDRNYVSDTEAKL